MVKIKKLLSRLLSEEVYLRTLHQSFFFLYSCGLLKRNPLFSYHYFIRKLIKPTDVVVDLGANLGYFTRTFSKLTLKGRVVAIEPIPLFFKVLTHFLGGKRNVELHNIALGKESGSVMMVMPETDGFIRTGLPHIATGESDLKSHKHQRVEIVSASGFFEKIGSFSYLKCDIEGYEGVVIPEILGILNRIRPLIQIEIAEINKKQLLPALEGIGYERFAVWKGALIHETGHSHIEGDYLFIPKEKVMEYTHFIRESVL